MIAMTMPQQSWYAGAAAYVGMWMAMMVPMMLPSLVPMLSRYGRSVRARNAMQVHGLLALVAVGYFAVWSVIGATASVATTGIAAGLMHSGRVAALPPLAAGLGLLLAGAIQFTSWKTRQLALCREESCGHPPAPNAVSALQHGLKLGVRCSLCCGSLMLALLATGMMDLAAMAVVTVAVSVERWAPARLRVARVVGVAIVTAGVLTIIGLY
jgi:predicted metal-binding membrane protein